MSEDPPEEPSLVRLFLELNARRNTAIGLAIGIALATIAYVYRVIIVDPVAGPDPSPVLFGALAVTLAITCGALVAIVLTVGSAIQRMRGMDREGNP